MEILKRYRFLLLVIVGIAFAAAAGKYVWRQRGAAYLNAAYARHSFLLLDDNRNFYGTKDLRRGERLLLVFSPDFVSGEVVAGMRRTAKDLPTLEAKNIQVALVARINMDDMRNEKKVAQYPGRILSDPGGSIGKITGAWPSSAPVKFWNYALVDKNFRILWLATSDHALAYSEFRKYVEARNP